MIAGAAPSATLIEGLEKINIHVNHVYGLTETYGPVTACVQLPEWDNLDRTEFYRRKAMQGHAYVVSDESRVIRIDSSAKDGFEDVAPDGKEVGEIVIRGNMVMKGRLYFHSTILVLNRDTNGASYNDRILQRH